MAHNVAVRRKWFLPEKSSAFRDVLCLRFNWPLKDVPFHCVCGETFSGEHCLSCPSGGFSAIRHNEVRDITAEILTEICSNVEVEPQLENLFGELLALRTSISGDEGGIVFQLMMSGEADLRRNSSK